MGILADKIKDDSNGSISEYFKTNSYNLYKKYQNPDDTVQNISISDITNGGFYLLFYLDESNWMRYSPVFVCEIRYNIFFSMNFNFIPLEIREQFFDKYIINLEENDQLSEIKFERCYKELIRYGFEYAIVEYDIKKIKAVLKIDISILPEFLYSSYPAVKYDPNKLYDIWSKKLKDREQRHQELIKTIVSNFYETKESLISEMTVLKNHFTRLKRNQEKFK